MTRPAPKPRPAELGPPRGIEGGPPPRPTVNPRFVRLLCKLYPQWAKDQDPSTWTSEANE